MLYVRIKCFLRGPLLTAYRMETQDRTHWWFYLPFNLGFGFSIPRRDKVRIEIPDPDLDLDDVLRASLSKIPEDRRYWN